MLVLRATDGLFVETDGRCVALPGLVIDDLIKDADPHARLRAAVATGRPASRPTALLPPIGQQEVWAAGVTYLRSRDARVEESQAAGGGDFYQRVYNADRPELFFKSAPHRVAAPGATMRLRRDSRWLVPEPELVLCVNPRGAIIGYTVGNDLSCRDIEGENPLYLPQAKVWDGSAALGPGLFLTPEPLPPETKIQLVIQRAGADVVTATTTLSRMKRTPPELVSWLYRETSFPDGAFLFTGTGIVPPDDFSLRAGDVVSITIAPIGTLENPVA